MLANILIVESEPRVRKLPQRALERVGYAVQGVGTNVEALRLCRTGTVDLVLADVGLPATGHELARTVAIQCPRTRVVLMAAWYSECEDWPYVPMSDDRQAVSDGIGGRQHWGGARCTAPGHPRSIIGAFWRGWKRRHNSLFRGTALPLRRGMGIVGFLHAGM